MTFLERQYVSTRCAAASTHTGTRISKTPLTSRPPSEKLLKLLVLKIIIKVPKLLLRGATIFTEPFMPKNFYCEYSGITLSVYCHCTS